MAKQQPLAETKKRDYWIIDSRRLIVDEQFNEREDYGDIDGLAAEIEAQGVTEPLKCYKKGEFYVVIRGHRRRLALKMLEEKGILVLVPVILEDKKKANTEMWILDQITSNDGKVFTAWEQAKVLRRLANFGWTEKDIKERSGKSIVYVRRLLSLTTAPQKLINLVRSGRVSATLAMEAIAEEKVDDLIAIGEKDGAEEIDHPFSLFPAESPQKIKTKITRSDLQKPTSWKVIQKKWIPGVDQNTVKPEKMEIFNWFKKLAEGTLSEEDFREFFI